MEKLDDLTEPTVAELEEVCGISLEDGRETHPVCNRGRHYTSQKLPRLRKKPVLVTKEIHHCPDNHAPKMRVAPSRPAPARCFTCHDGIPKFEVQLAMTNQKSTEYKQSLTFT